MSIVNIMKKNSGVFQGNLFGGLEEVKTGEKLSFAIEGIDEGLPEVTGTNKEFYNAVLRGLGLSSIFSFGQSGEESDLEISRRFVGEKPLGPNRCMLADARRILVRDRIKHFLIDELGQHETMQRHTDTYALACQRLRFAGEDEDLDALFNHFVDSMKPFRRRSLGEGRNLRKMVERAVAAKEIKPEKYADMTVEEIVHQKLKHTPRVLGEQEMQSLKELFRASDPDLQSERLLHIDWSLLTCAEDVHELLGLVSEIKEQRDIDDIESGDRIAALVEWHNAVKKECKTLREKGKAFSFAHILSTHLQRYQESQADEFMPGNGNALKSLQFADDQEDVIDDLAYLESYSNSEDFLSF